MKWPTIYWRPLWWPPSKEEAEDIVWAVIPNTGATAVEIAHRTALSLRRTRRTLLRLEADRRVYRLPVGFEAHQWMRIDPEDEDR